MKQKITISKLDAAKRQLETAIRLYFSKGDPVSIHTLTAAAYNVIRNLNTKRGGEPLFMKEQFLDWIKEGHEQEVRKKINEAENFFKHADRDHDGVIDFSPAQSELLMLEACSVYYKLSGEYPPLFKLYQGWFIANNPSMFNFPEEYTQNVAMGQQEIVGLGREKYFTNMLPILMRVNT